jgi:Spy/CpxP family protein refolding chaperone
MAWMVGCALVFSGAAWAQISPQPPKAGPAGEPSTQSSGDKQSIVQAEQRLRAVLKSLQLTEEQSQKVEALFQVLRAEVEAQDTMENRARIMNAIKEKWAEVKDLEQKGDVDGQNRAKEELRNLAPVQAAENSFYESLSQSLTDEQKKKLETLRKPELAMKPVDVIRAIHKIDLSKEQLNQFESILKEHRAKVAGLGPGADWTPAESAENLLSEVSQILKPEQIEKLNTVLNAARERSSGKPAPKSTTQPAKP